MVNKNKFFKFTILNLLLTLMISLNTFAQVEAVQTSFSISGNEVTVYMKSNQNIASSPFNYFHVDFKYFASNNPVIFSISSYNSSLMNSGVNQNPSLISNNTDPNNSDYSIQRFGFSGGNKSVSLVSGTEYEVFKFTISNGIGYGSIGLVYDYTNYSSNPYIEFNGTDYTNWTDPFYGSLINSDYSINSEDWMWRTFSMYFGKYWKSNAASTAWATASNWSDNLVPTGTDNLTILAGANKPIAGAGSVCNKLQIETGATVDVAYNGTLTVNDNLTIADNNSLIIRSTASGTGSLITNGAIPNGAKFKVELYITGDKWHLLSSPITNATANVVTPAQTGTTTPVYLRQFSESTNAWSYITDITTALDPAKGYAIWADLTAGGATNPTITFTGTLNANASIPYTNSNSGWNLLGNPYTSALDWNAVTGKASLAGGAFYCWNSTSGKYSVSDGYAAVNQVNIVSPYSIPAMQGFFVKATAVGSLGISTAKIHSAIPYYKSSNSLNDMVRLTAQRGLFKDEALVLMNSSATNNYDEAYDASKFFANNTDIPEIYTLAGSEKIAINKIGSFPSVVPVNIKMGVADNVTIKASDFANFDASVYIILEDMLNGTFQNLRQNPSYTFAAAVGENAGRFNLHFSYNALIVNDVKKENASIYSSNNTIYVNSSEKINDISIYNMLGQLIVNKAGNLNAMNTITVQAANAYYIVKVTTVNGVYTEKVYVK